MLNGLQAINAILKGDIIKVSDPKKHYIPSTWYIKNGETTRYNEEVGECADNMKIEKMIEIFNRFENENHFVFSLVSAYNDL